MISNPMADIAFKVVLNQNQHGKNNACAVEGCSNTKKAGMKRVMTKKQKKKEPVAVREARDWDLYIRKHKQEIAGVKSKIDNLAPMLPAANLYSKTLLSHVDSSARELDETGMVLLKYINQINRTRGRTRTLSPTTNKSPATHKSSAMAARKAAAFIHEKENRHMYCRIKKARSKVETVAECAERWVSVEKAIADGSEWPLYWKEVSKPRDKVEVSPPRRHVEPYITLESSKFLDKRSRVEFEVSMSETGVVGKFLVQLYNDYVPKTVKNFLTYCDPDAAESYKGNRFYLIFKDYFCQTGDVAENAGFGSTSIYGPDFPNEDCTLQHGQRGLLTTYQARSGRNNSQFLITFKPLLAINGQHVVFGKIVRGMSVVDAIESAGTWKSGRPQYDVYISHVQEV